MSIHPLLFWYSPTKHHLVFEELRDFCIVSSGVSGSGSFNVRFTGPVPTFSSPIIKLPTFCTVPSAISTPVLVTSAVISAALFTAEPVESHNNPKKLLKEGPNNDTPL